MTHATGSEVVDQRHRDVILSALERLPNPPSLYRLVGEVATAEGIQGLPVPFELKFRDVWLSTETIVEDLFARGQVDILPPRTMHTDPIIAEAFQRVILK